MIRKTALILSALAITAVAAVTVLFLVSEDVMQNKNPFIRRFTPHTAQQVGSIDLKYNSYYFAGHDGDRIYLGNYSAPLRGLSIGRDFKTNAFTIIPQASDFRFKRLRLRVAGSLFYLMDGSVPCIYSGNTASWNASLSDTPLPFFDSAVPTVAGGFIFRANSSIDGSYILGNFTSGKSEQPKLFNGLLKTQDSVDGIFGSDGELGFSSSLGRFVYVYRYRNQFLVCRPDGLTDYKGKTIDTVERPAIKVAAVRDKREKMMAAPPLTVNAHTAVAGNLLFIDSPLRGKYDDAGAWRNNSTIDVYDLRTNRYLSSFYVAAFEGRKLTSIYVAGNHLYAMIDSHLQVYELSALSQPMPDATQNGERTATLQYRDKKKD